MERCFEKELREIRGGTAVAYEFNLGECIDRALRFLKEYKDEIIRGLKKGWNRFERR
jgi:hypothetical protein